MSLRSRLFVGISATVLVSLVVTVVAGALLTRRSLEHASVRALERQVELVLAQRQANPGRGTEQDLGQFLATDEQRLAIVTPAQAELLLPEHGAARLRTIGEASGSVDVRGKRFLYAAKQNADEAIVLLRPASRAAADWTPFAVGLGVAGLVGAALAAIVALLLSRAVARPIARVSEASRALAAGEHPEPLRPSGPREVAALATSFDHLSVELARTQHAEQAFLLSVSHELKTPLTAIRGHAEALQDGVLEPAGAGTVIEREAR
ncbi:MAG TPA: HAMP domain-containing protein, partial [Gaiella sp.]|nr:HAMP domain-containing protein [Gaiella sp.]